MSEETEEAPPAHTARRYLAEGFTIMLGILAALVVDAAWGWRVDRVREAEYLAGLAEEFGEAFQELEADQIRRAQMLDASELLLNARADPTAVEADSLARALVDVLDYRFYTPSHPVLGEVLGTGGLDVLRSDSLRMELRRYSQERDRLEVAERLSIDIVMRQLRPYVAERISLDRLIADRDDIESVTAADQGDSLVALLRADSFGSLLYLRQRELRTALRFASGLRRQIRRVLEAL